jgi:outer membrane murein-binding lipoprotein Lpp
MVFEPNDLFYEVKKMRKRTVFACICLSTGLLLSGCANATNQNQTPQTLENTTEQTTTEAVPLISETQKTTETENTKANVQLYEGTYFDEGVYQYVDIPATESPFVYCNILISNITDTSFDFAIFETVMATNESTVIFPTSTAFFTGDGTEAIFNGKDQTLHFEFPKDQDLYPIIRDMKVTGFSKLEGNTYINNSIPGHEAG